MRSEGKNILKLYNMDCMDFLNSCNTVKSWKFDLIITDPPYGIKYQSNLQTGNRRSGKQIEVRTDAYFDKIMNDDAVPVDWIYKAFGALRENGAMYVFCHWSKWSYLEHHAKEAGFKIKNMIVINKSNHGMGDLNGSYAPKHELVMFCTKGKHKLNRIGGRKKDVIDLPVKYSGAKHLHPNEKPISWIETFLLESSKEGDEILDPFAGSSTVGVACKKHNRTFMGIEIDEQYFKVSQERLNLNEENILHF